MCSLKHVQGAYQTSHLGIMISRWKISVHRDDQIGVITTIVLMNYSNFSAIEGALRARWKLIKFEAIKRQG